MKKISELSEQEKSLMLAELARWTVKVELCRNAVITPSLATMGFLEPYAETTIGLAQAHAILLEFPEAMLSFVVCIQDDLDADVTYEIGNIGVYEPTQSNILDEILIMQNKATR
jgi:hypothetical protein